MRLSGRDYASGYRAFRDFFPHAFNERAIARPGCVHLRHATVLNMAVISRGSSGLLTMTSHKKGKEEEETSMSPAMDNKTVARNAGTDPFMVECKRATIK